MKKITSFLIAVGLALATFSAHAAGGLVSDSFINAGQNLVVSNNTTVTNLGLGVYYFSYKAGTNIQSGFTNAVNTNIIYPSWESDVAGPVVDANGNYSSNVVLEVVFNNTNLIANPSEPGTPSRMSSPPALTPNVIVPTAASSNVVTFTLQASADSVYYQQDGSTNGRRWQFSFIAPGTTSTLLLTNPPANFINGMKSFTLYSVGADNSPSSPGVIITQCRLVHWEN